MFEEFNKNMEALSDKNFEDTLSFKRACNFVEESALHDNRLSKDVVAVYDKLLKSDLPEDINKAICYNLGEMLHFQPELRPDVKNVVFKHKNIVDEFLQNNTTPFNDGLESVSKEISNDMAQKDLLIQKKLKKRRKVLN